MLPAWAHQHEMLMFIVCAAAPDLEEERVNHCSIHVGKHASCLATMYLHMPRVRQRHLHICDRLHADIHSRQQTQSGTIRGEPLLALEYSSCHPGNVHSTRRYAVHSS